MSSQTLTYSILVPCYNERTVVLDKIADCLRQDTDTLLQIIFVDDFSKDETFELLQNYVANNPETCRKVVLTQNRHTKGKNGAVETGFDLNRADLILITDADVRIEPPSLLSALALFRNRKVGGVSLAPQLYSREETMLYAFIYERTMRRIRCLQTRLDSIPLMYGSAMILRASLNVRPHPRLFGDDVHFALSIRKKGYRVLFAANSFYLERLIEEANYIDQKCRRLRGMITAYVFHRDMLFNPRYGLMGLFGLPLDWFLIFIQPLVTCVLLISALAALTISFGCLGPILTALVILCLAAAIKYNSIVHGFFLINYVIFKEIFRYLRRARYEMDWKPPREE